MLEAFLLADCIESGDDVVGIPIRGVGRSGGEGMLRLRGATRCAHRPAALRMTGTLRMTRVYRMTRLFRVAMLMCGVFACFLSSAGGTTYYVRARPGVHVD